MPRTSCAVPGCRRTTKQDSNEWPAEWVCGKHWPLVSRRLKKKYSTVRRIARKRIAKNPMISTYWKMKPGSPERIRAVRMYAALSKVWKLCKEDAIEKALGIR